MKKGILFLLLASTVVAHGQSLKDALFSGKLKNTPGTVIRKGEDLSTKMDTANKATMDEAVKTNTTPTLVDSTQSEGGNPANSSVSNAEMKKADTEATAPSKEKPAVPKSNNAVWKEYVDTVISTLKTEVLPSKKIKAGTYYVTVSYTINTDGKTDIGDVFLSPDNSYLQQQIKERLTLDPPSLSPVLNSSGTPTKVIRKYNFTLSK